MATVSDGKLPENNDTPLVVKMKSLELNESANSSSSFETSSTPRKRTLRKRIPTVENTEKRRKTIKPKKHLSSGSSSSTSDIKDIYLCKKFKRISPNLETIFEEPKVSKSNEILYTAVRKERRFIAFDQINKGKIKKRQVKMKRIFGRSTLKVKRGSMDALLEKLSVVE